jgi:hypothetical protein
MSGKCHLAQRAWRACTPRTGTVLIDLPTLRAPGTRQASNRQEGVT